MSNNSIQIRISKIEDIKKFYYEYTNNNELREKFFNKEFQFKISIAGLLSDKESVESLLFELALISQHFKKQFILICIMPKKPSREAKKEEHDRYKEVNNIKFKIHSYLSTVGGLIDVRIFHDKKSLPKAEDVKRMMPVMEIKRELLGFLASPIKQRVLNRWINKQLKLSPEEEENMQVRFLCNQCARLLYGPLEEAKIISDLRVRAFCSEHFVGVMKNIPFISLLIFAMFDYAYREDAAETLKDKIKKELKLKKITLKEEDILKQLQNKQKYIRYQKNEELKRNGYDNKTIFDDDDKLHPFIIKEMYEAITISEGLYQLIENIVWHANDEPGKGEGVLSFYIHNLDKDKLVLEKKYPAYFKSHEPHAKFMLEVNIADLSDTDIPNKFRENNDDFRYEDHTGCPEEIGNPVCVFDNIILEDFFKPDEKKIKWWRYFFSSPDRVINHYGLQIFNSVIEAKGGYFFVQSADEIYSSVADSEYTLVKEKGTAYTILLPLDGRAHYDNNIYDSMFKYSLSSYVGREKELLEQTNIPDKPTPPFNKVKYIDEILSCLPKKINSNKILLFDFNILNNIHLECLVKAVLKLIFSITNAGKSSEYKHESQNKNEQQNRLYIAFINCKYYQLIEILRIIALYYDKQGVNKKMDSVEIYIRGENIGEEVLIFGENLETLRNNISQSACMRGLSYEYMDTLDKILSDREVR